MKYLSYNDDDDDDDDDDNIIPQENDLKKALKIRYVGGGEEGLDLGGLQKEFFHIIINDIIQPGKCEQSFFASLNTPKKTEQQFSDF